MNFRDLEYLVTVARLEHFGKAAQACHVSQSALSLQLQKLEREIGVQLIERTNRRVVVTHAGKEAVRQASALLIGKQELLDNARLLDGHLPPQVRVGAIPTIAPYLFGSLRTLMGRSFSKTSCLFDEEVTERLVAKIANGELEAGILATPVEDTLLEELPLFDEPFLLAVPTRHRLAKKPLITPNDLTDEALLLLKDTHCLKEQIEGFCITQKISAQRQSTAASITTLLALVRAHGGITLIPKMAIDPKQRLTGIRTLSINPPPNRRIRVVFRKTSRVGRKLAEAISDSLANSS